MRQRKTIFDDPSEVEAVQGAVELEGPDDVDVALTPEAAEETSDRIANEVMKARGQRRLGDLPHQPKK